MDPRAFQQKTTVVIPAAGYMIIGTTDMVGAWDICGFASNELDAHRRKKELKKKYPSRTFEIEELR